LFLKKKQKGFSLKSGLVGKSFKVNRKKAFKKLKNKIQ